MRYGITQELLIDLDFNVEYPVKAPLMRLPDEVSSFLEQLYPLFPQILPLAVVILSPVFVLYLANSSTLSWQISMVFDSLGSLFSWSSSRDSSTSSDSAERKRLRKRPVRTRAEQVAVLNGDAAYAYPLTPKERDSEGYYPGLVNLSGTYCFLNATLQALASLSYLQPHIEDIHARAVALNIATPVIDPLRYMLKVLNTPRSYPKAERPIELIAALSTDPSGRRNPLLYSREHQDAQELFQLMSESIKREITAVDKESLRDRGLGGIYGQTGHPRLKDAGKTVFDGLTANRRSCVVCGYTEAVMHFAFDNWQLAVPRVAACHLMDCLFDYTRLEKLTDCICQKCSMLATYQKLLQEAERLTALTSVDPTPSSSKKKRSRDARKLEARVKAALEQGRIEEDIPGVKLEKVYSRESTKQAMIARPPPVLALHLNRSVHHGHYAAKNVCYVEFPEFLDLTPFTTSGQLSTAPTVPISSPSQSPSRSLTPTPPNINAPRTYYRLSAVVCHYGQHSYGHYICYRRKPRSPAAGANRFLPPKLACPWTCECDKCSRFGNVRMDDDFDVRRRHGQGWLRISDETVQECGIETVLQEGSAAFMLFYEKILQPRSSFNPPSQTLRGSEETVRPKDVQDNGSSIALVDSERARTNEMARSQSPPGKLVRPRVVRNVSAARRSKSPSYPPSAPSASYQRESLPQPSTMNGNTAKTQQNGHGSNGSARPPPESNSTSWYQNSANSRSRASSSATSHTSKNSVLQRTHQPSNSLQYQPQRLQT